jgi:ABC-2 type transport system ATP-binding protein
VDPISRREFWELLYRLREEGILIVITTAYMDEAERCDRVHLLERGQLLATGEPKEVMRREKVKSFEELFLRHAKAEAKR